MRKQGSNPLHNLYGDIMHEECENCPHRGQCGMECWNEYHNMWTPDWEEEE